MVKTESEIEKIKKRANELDGKTWNRYSISIWSDIRKSKEEQKLNHPAMFPAALPMRLIEIFTNKSKKMVLDPFMGTGSTLIAASRLGKNSIGCEISKEYCDIAQRRLEELTLFDSLKGKWQILNINSLKLLDFVPENYVDLVITSPPYWDILSLKRTADYKTIHDYGEEKGDLAKIKSYNEFLKKLQEVFQAVYKTMKVGSYCCVNVMDIRKKDIFYPFHMDTTMFMTNIGFILDDIIIWDRRQEYNNMRPLGYPSVFRVNKAHEYILIFLKPKK